MTKRVFFSWQSDNKPVRNKIGAALEYAVAALGRELDLAERPELDSDTSGRFSSEDIMGTILEKIEAATLFVADVTPIASKGDKLIPNPNVMAEVGYAIAVKQRDTRLYLFVSDVPNAEEKMPFDIRGKKLFKVDINLSPREIGEQLKPRLEWMLQQTAGQPPQVEHPLIYATGAGWHKWANDARSVSLNIRNADNKEYLLEAIELAGFSSEPMRALPPDATTQGIVINGPDRRFETPDPVLKMTVSRHGVKHRLVQKIITSPRADGKFNLNKFVETSTPVLF